MNTLKTKKFRNDDGNTITVSIVHNEIFTPDHLLSLSIGRTLILLTPNESIVMKDLCEVVERSKLYYPVGYSYRINNESVVTFNKYATGKIEMVMLSCKYPLQPTVFTFEQLSDFKELKEFIGTMELYKTNSSITTQ